MEFHITAICTKANQKLGFIKRNLKGTPRELKRLAYVRGGCYFAFFDFFYFFKAQNMVDTIQIKDQKEFLEYDPRNPPVHAP